jgi:hypothetical protein
MKTTRTNLNISGTMDLNISTTILQLHLAFLPPFFVLFFIFDPLETKKVFFIVLQAIYRERESKDTVS